MIFAFGEFELDVRLCVLRRGSEPVAVQPKVFDTLRYLIEHRDRVVSKAELLDVVWDGQRLSGVAVPWSIRHARRALGQAGVERQPIETVRGRGYRFAAEVRASTDPASAGRTPTIPPGMRPAGEPFLGRDAVIQRLSDALEAAQRGRGSLCLLVGEAGIGKTRCAGELAGLARQAGVAVSMGRCTATEGAPAFWPWIRVLRDLHEDRKLSVEERNEARAALDRLVPGPTPGALTRPSQPPAVPGAASRFWLTEAITRPLRQISKRRPRVLVFEDLHAADEGSVEVLSQLAPDLAQSHLLVIATSRDDVGGRLSRRVRPCDVVLLSGLEVADVERYLLQATGHAAPPDLAEFVHDRTGGNPLFLKEAARMVVAQREATAPGRGGDVTLPEVARGFLHDRIATLRADTRDVLDAASVIGEEFDLGVLGRVLDLPTDRLLSCMDDALESRIVERRPRDTFAFAHALLRDALYDGLSTARRARLHRGVAAALQGRAAVEHRFRAVAYHLHQALPDADPREVERYSRLAGDDAMRVCAYADAAELYRWAISAQGLEGAPDVRATCELLMSGAYAERQAGRVNEARDYCGRAIEIATRMNFGDLLVKAARSLRPTVWLAPVPDPLVLDAVEHALDILPPEASAARVQAYGLLANLPPHSSNIERSRELSGRALQMARELGDRSLLLEALVRAFPALTGPAAVDELLAVSDEVLRLDGPPPTWWSAEAFLARYHALTQTGDAVRARRALDAFGECAKLLRIDEATWQYDRLCAQRAIYAGDFEQAELRFAELFARSEGFREYAAFHYAAQMNALSWARSGRPLLTTVLGFGADVAWQWASSIPAFRAERMMTAVSGGETAVAAADLDDLVRDDFRLVTRDIGYLYTLARLAQAAVALGRRDAATALYEALRPYSRFNAVNGMSLGLGCVAQYLGLLARFLGRPGDAREHFELAVAMNAQQADRVHEREAREALA
jgi:DNA-binding winged helix-turn-helix (wHTH) protein/tetratricopeptide (TPR) repeat protein